MPTIQPLVPGTTVAWTPHGNPSVPTFAPGKTVNNLNILVNYDFEIFNNSSLFNIGVMWPIGVHIPIC